jgi:protein-L-isoaspartate(D-aspartate) O-methyltransferase
MLVPTTYLIRPNDGSVTATPVNTAECFDLVYSTETLITAVESRYGTVVPISSSTTPDLMIRMLEALDIHEGHRVLEIGTGTGYNAALLAHRLGDERVFSVDIDPDLVTTARQRLADIGHHPALAVADGADGWSEHAPYDRIIVTCAVPAIPWAWYEQLACGGRLLVDLKQRGYGNLVLLQKRTDRLEGRFTSRYAAFMTMRHKGVPPPSSADSWQPEYELTTERTTTTPLQLPVVVGFLRSILNPVDLRRRPVIDPNTGQPSAMRFSAADGSVCEVTIASTSAGRRVVYEGGPTALWAGVERVHQQWHDWGQPGWSRLGITATAATCHLWLDEPHNILASMPGSIDGWNP